MGAEAVIQAQQAEHLNEMRVAVAILTTKAEHTETALAEVKHQQDEHGKLLREMRDFMIASNARKKHREWLFTGVRHLATVVFTLIIAKVFHIPVSPGE